MHFQELRLESQRLLLKPVLSSQLDTLHNIFTNPYVRKYLFNDRVVSLQEVEQMLLESQKLFKEQRFGLWFIETKEKQKIIRFTGLWYFFAEKQPQLAYALLPQSTKKGYATEASNRILEYCFNDLGYQYLLASCDKPNIESQKVAQRIGMKEVEKRIIDDSPTLFFKIEKQ